MQKSIDWLEFVGIEMFDSYEIVRGSDGCRSYSDLLLVAGSRTFRLNVRELPAGLDGSQDSPFEMHHPMSVMRGRDVRSLTHVVDHAEARQMGLLLDVSFATECIRETANFGIGGSFDKSKHVTLPMFGSQVLNPLRRILYVAHRWQASSIHDPAQKPLLELVQRSVRDEDFVWMDFWSVPNSRSDPGKDAAIKSMQEYVYRATKLHGIAVSDQDLRKFMERTWCQVELFAALCPVLAEQDAFIGCGTGGRSSFDYKSVYRHACDVEIIVAGKDPQKLNMEYLRNPLTCDITSPEDLELLKPALERIRDSTRSARPTGDGDDYYEDAFRDNAYERVSGIEDEKISAMLMALGTLATPGARAKRKEEYLAPPIEDPLAI